jgi:ADP-ribose pyrophosphatase
VSGADPRLPRALLPFREVERGAPDVRRVFTVRQDIVESEARGRRLQVDRLDTPDWVNVIAVDAHGHLVLVRQWRFGTQAFTVELPAGMVETGEDPVQTGLRELLEETGYAPLPTARIQTLGAVRPNAAFMNNRCTTVWVEPVERAAGQSLDDNEEIEVLTLSPGDLEAAVRSGHVDTALVLAALTLWRLAQSPDAAQAK